MAASLGKVGAFVGTYVFPIIQDNAPNALRAGQDPFWIASSLAVFSGIITLVCLPDIKQDTIDTEDRAFRAYLTKNGYDVASMGLFPGQHAESGHSTSEASATKVDVSPEKLDH